jgi:TP901 family phage tail tape measure protein
VSQREELVVEVSGRGLDGTLLGLEKLEKGLERTHSRATTASAVWGKTTRALSQLEIAAKTAASELFRVEKALTGMGQMANPFANIKLAASTADNAEKLNSALQNLNASARPLSQSLGKTVGAFMRIKSTANEAAIAVRAVGTAYGFLNGKALAMPKGGVSTPKLSDSYKTLTQHIRETIKALDDLVAAYGRTATAQGALAQKNKTTLAPTGAGGQAAPGVPDKKGTLGRFASSVGGYVARFGTAAGLIVGGKQIGEYEDNIAALGATLDIGEKRLESFRAQAIKTAQDSRISLTDASEAMLELARAGISKPGELSILAPAISKAAVAGQMGAAETTELAVNTMAQFRMEAEDIPAMLGKLTKAANISVIGFKEIGVSMKYAGEAAATLGTDFDQTLAAIATLGQVGKKGSTGGTTLRQMLNQLAVGNEKTTTFLDAVAKKTGIAREQFDITRHSLVQVLENLKAAQPTAKDLFTTFDKQGGSGFIALINNIDMMKRSLAQIKPTGFEEVERVAARMNNTLPGQTSRFVNSLVAALAKINTGLGDPFKSLFSLGADAINMLVKFGEEVGSFSERWPKLGAAIKVVTDLLMFKGLTSVIKLMTNNIGLLSSAVAGLKGAFQQAAAGSMALAGSTLWKTLKANAPLLAMLAAYEASKAIKVDPHSSTLDRASDLTGGIFQGMKNRYFSGDVKYEDLTGIPELDSAVYRKDEIDKKITELKESKKGLFTANKELQDYLQEKARLDAFLLENDYASKKNKSSALSDEFTLGGEGLKRAIEHGRAAREKEFLKIRSEQEAMQQEAEAEAFKGTLGKAKDWLMGTGAGKILSSFGAQPANVLPPKEKKDKRRDVNEITAELKKATEDMQLQLRAAHEVENEMETSRRKITDDLRGILKSRLGLDADQEVPALYESLLQSIKEDPASAAGTAQAALVDAINAGASKANLGKLTDMSNLAEIGLLRDMIAETEREQKALEALKTTAVSAYKEIDAAADRSASSTAKRRSTILNEDSLTGEIARVSELYSDKTKAILAYADALEKAGLTSKAAVEWERLGQADANIFRMAQSEAQKKATARFDTSLNPMEEALRSPYGGSTLLDLSQSIDEMGRLYEISKRISEIDYQNKNITFDQMTEQINKAADAFERFNKMAEDRRMMNWTRDAAMAMTDVFGQSIQTVFDAMVDGAKNMEDVFKSVAKSIISSLFRILVVENLVDAAKTGINAWLKPVAAGVGAGIGAAAGGISAANGPAPAAAAPTTGFRAGTWPTGAAANSMPVDGRVTRHDWLAQSSALGTRHPPTPTETAAPGPVTNSDGSVNEDGKTTVNQTFNIKTPDPNSFRRSARQTAAVVRRFGRS